MDKELRKTAKLRLLGIILCVVGIFTVPLGLLLIIAGIIVLIMSIKQQKKYETNNASVVNTEAIKETKPTLREIWNNDEILVKCSFLCEGKPYKFYKENCGGGNYLKIDYFDAHVFKLNEICINKDSSGTYLVLSYSSFSQEKKTTQIPVLSSEEHTAKELVEILTTALKEYDIKKVKEKEDRDALYNQTVKAIDLDGNEIEIKSYSRQLADTSLCIFAEGGKTYHTWLDCYTKWPEEMRNGFQHWHIIKTKDAIKQGYRKCSFCEQRDYNSNHIDALIENISKEDE